MGRQSHFPERSGAIVPRVFFLDIGGNAHNIGKEFGKKGIFV